MSIVEQPGTFLPPLSMRSSANPQYSAAFFGTEISSPLFRSAVSKFEVALPPNPTSRTL